GEELPTLLFGDSGAGAAGIDKLAVAFFGENERRHAFGRAREIAYDRERPDLDALHLDPRVRTSLQIARVRLLRHDPLEAHAARIGEEFAAVALDMLAELDGRAGIDQWRKETLERLLARDQGRGGQVEAVEI